jgi:hypothetical protein
MDAAGWGMVADDGDGCWRVEFYDFTALSGMCMSGRGGTAPATARR